MPAGRVLALRAGDAGTLWVGTENGAARLASARFELIKETAGKVITAIISPQPGRVIMASESGVIFDCQVKPDQSIAVRTVPDQPLQSADVDHPGPLKITSVALVGEKLYAGTQSRGLLVIENGEVKEVGGKPRAFFINAVETDGQGHLWAGARARGDESGLLDLGQPQKPTRARAATGAVTAIARGAHDDIWVATDNRGAFHLLNGKLIEHFTFEETGGALRSDHIFGVFVDAEEVVWFATDKGVCRYDPHATRTENISNDAATNYVRALRRTSQGQVLAGTNSGLFVYQAGNEKWLNIPELGRRIIYAIHEDNNGRVLVATANGLFGSPAAKDLSFQRIGTEERLPQGDSVRAVANAGGATYVATYGYGVEKLEGTKRSLVWPASNAEDRQREVVSLNADGGGRLLIGTASAGLFFFDGKQTTTESALDPLKNESIWAAVADGNGFWLATGRGLYFYQSDQLREIVGNTSARSIFAGSGRAGEIWCATVGSGLLRVILDEQFGAIVSRLDVEQGLPSQRVFAVLTEKTADGSESVIAGTNRGIVRYEPGLVTPTVLPARIISQRIHQQAELNAGLQLEYPQNSLLLDVTAISSRTFPEQFQYAFALYDSGGKVIREKLSRDSQFAMEGLQPGSYRVVARAFTKDLLPATPLKFDFSVAGAPFPWTTTALAVLLLFALIALTWAAIEHRRIVTTSGALAAANRELAGARLQLANETEAERRRIARDLHDQTLADLRNLMLSVDQLPATTNNVLSFRGGRESEKSGEREAAGQFSPVSETADHAGGPARYDPIKLRAEIESISQEVRRICEDLSPSVLQNVGFAAALEFALNHAVEHAPPDCQFAYDFICDESFDDRVKLPASVQIQIYRIAQEALSNICRHAGASHVRMSVSAADDGTLALEIEDDGRGFDARSIKKKPGRGVANIRARASMIDAEVAWVQREGGGTVFRLRKQGSEARP